MLKNFLTRVLPKAGRYAIFQNRHNTFFDTLNELLAACEHRLDSKGLYFATAAYGDARNEAGNLQRTQANVRAIRAYRYDLDAGAKKLAKHGHGAVYATQEDAIASLVAFVKATQLLPTYIVSSGEGLHVYWCLSDEVPGSTWTPVASLLHKVGTAHGLKIDSACTSDSARVLRPIGAMHDNGKRVAILKATDRLYAHEEFASKVRALAPAEEEWVAPARAPKARSINDDVLHVEGPPSSLERVAQFCAAVATMRDRAGNVPEPHWRAVMGVAKYCEDGEQLVHAWSSGYEGYSKRETQEKFDRWETPPTTCQHFSLLHENCRTCAYRTKITTPKQLGYIVTQPAPSGETATEPASPGPNSADPCPESTGDFGMVLEDDEGDAAPANCPVPDRPDLFDEASDFFYKLRDGRWTMYHRFQESSKDATGQTVLVTLVKPVVYRLFWADSNAPAGDNGNVVIQWGRVDRVSTGHVAHMSMPAGTSTDARAMSKYLADNGINLAPRSVNKRAIEHIMEFVAREIRDRQEDMRFVLKERFGYHFHDGKFVCAMGRHTVYPDGTVLRTAINPKLNGLAESLRTDALPDNKAGRWDAQCWAEMAPAMKRYIRFLRTHYGHKDFEMARLAISMNLASPFLVFAADSVYKDAEDMPSVGFILSLYSEASGLGKTSLMQAIAAAYGKDTLARKGNRGSITDIAAATLAKQTAIYPFFLDEVTQNDAQHCATLVDTFANGSGRVRATNTGDVSRPAATWALVTTLATNIPQREMLAMAQKRSDALLMRLMELNFDKVPRTGDVDAFRADLKLVQKECGAFGMYQALLAVKAGREKLSAMAAANVVLADKLLGTDQRFRFFARVLGAMLTNQQLLGQWAPFNTDELVKSFKQAVQDASWFVQTNQTTPDIDLAQLLSWASPQVVVTKGWTRRVGKGADYDVVLNTNVRMPLMGREVQEQGVVHLDAQAVRAWCIENQRSVSAFIKSVDDAGLLVKVDGKERTRIRLTTGIVNMASVMGYYYTFRTRRAQAGEAEGGGSNVVPLHPTDDPETHPAEQLLVTQ